MAQRPQLNENGIQYEVSGLNKSFWTDAYYYLISATWLNLFLVAFAGYLIVNILFATLYWLGGDGIDNAEPGSFADAFYFSVQTFSTIGYGSMSPKTTYSHLLVTIESFIGVIAVAMATGLIFAKFSRPNARVVFSEVIPIHLRNGVPTLHIRAVNQRRNRIINAKATLSVLVSETSPEGHTFNRFHSIELVRDTMPLFAITWILMHELNENSPLRQLYEADELDRIGMLLVSIEGIDSTFMQTVQAAHFFAVDAFRAGHTFIDVASFDDASGRITVQHEKIHMTQEYRPRQEGQTES